jgi:GntR family transcriptional repressor for pyruvate dehydrogenase complex
MVEVSVEHRAIADAVLKGDAAAAREAATRHMNNAARRLHHAAPCLRRSLEGLLDMPTTDFST